MKSSMVFFVLIVLFVFSGCSQTNTKKQKKENTFNKKVGGGCEGCEAIYESPVPFEKLSNVDTLPDFNDAGPKIEISGIVYQKDGKTPAKDVVIYIYHTDQKGVYPKRGDEKGWGKRHGYLRGWLKTDKKGIYKFYTQKPAAYPGRSDPAHIHITIKEPGLNEYWIDDYQFDDDPLLTTDKRKKLQNRGGIGIINLVSQENGISQSSRNIILGLNVPDYPHSKIRIGAQ